MKPVVRAAFFIAGCISCLLYLGTSSESTRLVMFVAGGVCFLVAWLQPSRQKTQAQLDAEHAADVAAEIERRLNDFQTAVDAASGNANTLRGLNAVRERLELTEKEVGYYRLEELLAQADLLDFQSSVVANGDSLLPVSGHDQFVEDGILLFRCRASDV
jgi:hypothetical protein